jgi:type IV pilus assembly protein PilW
MVAMTVGLFLVGGLLTVYLNTSRTNNEMAKMNLQMENGQQFPLSEKASMYQHFS